MPPHPATNSETTEERPGPAQSQIQHVSHLQEGLETMAEGCELMTSMDSSSTSRLGPVTIQTSTRSHPSLTCEEKELMICYEAHRRDKHGKETIFYKNGVKISPERWKSVRRKIDGICSGNEAAVKLPVGIDGFTPPGSWQGHTEPSSIMYGSDSEAEDGELEIEASSESSDV